MDYKANLLHRSEITVGWNLEKRISAPVEAELFS
jgi:hypothetical protein